MALILKSLGLSANVFCSNTRLFFRLEALSVRCLAAVSTPKVKEHPRTPYILFYADKYGELSRANPGVGIPQIARMMGQLWRLLPDDQKQTYRTRYWEEKALLDAEHKTKLDAMTDAERNQLKLAAKEKLLRRKRLRRNRLVRQLDKPKAGDVNPFMLFVKAKTMDRGEAPLQQYIKGLGEHWKKMPDDDKEEYIKTARLNSARYRARLVEWERQMIAQGHPELVRQAVLKKAMARPASGKKPTKKDKKAPSDAPSLPDDADKAIEKPPKTKPKAKVDAPAPASETSAKPKSSKKKPPSHSEE